MGYEVFITRADDPAQSKNRPIDDEEWQNLIRSNPTLKITPENSYERHTRDAGTERFVMTLWIAHPDKPPFMLIDGAIQIKSPDESTLQKMTEIAEKLRARVISEDGELYPPEPSAYNQPDSEQARRPFPDTFFPAHWKLWKRLLVAFLVGCILLVLKLFILGFSNSVERSET